MGLQKQHRALKLRDQGLGGGRLVTRFLAQTLNLSSPASANARPEINLKKKKKEIYIYIQSNHIKFNLERETCQLQCVEPHCNDSINFITFQLKKKIENLIY